MTAHAQMQIVVDSNTNTANTVRKQRNATKINENERKRKSPFFPQTFGDLHLQTIAIFVSQITISRK